MSVGRRRPTLRRYAPRDRAAVYDICIRTGHDGEDARDVYARAELVPEIWAGPYLALMPDLAWVAVDDADEPVGYVLGVADTVAFAAACEDRWWPAARARNPVPAQGAPASDASLYRALHDPPGPLPGLVAAYPAHLHVDLLPRAQGTGTGRALLETLFAELRRRRVPGLHLGASDTNTRAIAFYEHLGLRVLEERPGVTYLGIHL